MKRVGIILLDGFEIIIKLYELQAAGKNKLLRSEDRELASFKSDNLIMPSAFIEVIAEATYAGSSLQISDWKICSRNLPDSITKKISGATNTTIESLIPSREHELLSLGLLNEFYTTP